MSNITELQSQIERLQNLIDSRQMRLYEEWKAKWYEIDFGESHLNRMNKLESEFNRWKEPVETEIQKLRLQLEAIESQEWTKD